MLQFYHLICHQPYGETVFALDALRKRQIVPILPNQCNTGCSVDLAPYLPPPIRTSRL